MTQFTIDNYITINGRLRRKDYWLLRIPPAIIYGIVVTLSGLHVLPQAVSLVIVLTLLVIFIMMDIRRFHDRGKSGWWVLISLIPIVGIVWMFIEIGFLRGTIGPNRYGSDPVTTG